jgi:competence protein ComEC
MFHNMRRVRRTTLITTFCLAVLAGLGLARKVAFEPVIWPLLLATPCLLLLKSKNIVSALIVIFLGLSIGLWRGSLYMQNIYQLRSLTGQNVTIEARATADAVYSARSQIEFTANNAQLLRPVNKAVAGSFKISGFGVQMVYRGDIVRVSGKLYPMRGSNQARIAYAQLQRSGGGQSLINDFTRKFNAGMQTALPEPMASFGLGLLIGQRSTLPKDITSALTAVGLVHIVAVSGYNLTILVRGVGRLRLGSKYQKLLLSLALIVSFVLVTGFSASIVRAALVSVLSLWAWYYGRRIKPSVLIAFAAAVTGLINPFYVWGDLGWYLSFLAFFGVLVIAPIIAVRLFARPPKLLSMVLIETLSAELMTLPLILMAFSQLSIVALVANLLIVPLVPLAMLLAAIAGIAGAFVPQVAGWFALPARLLLTYMLDVVHMLSNVPSALIHRSINVAYMITLYALVLLIVLAAHRKLPKNKPVIVEETAL